MPATWNSILSSASSDLVFAGGGRSRPLTVRRSAAARGLRLSVDPRDGTVRLSLPARAALRPALLWAEGKRGWVEDALAALPEGRPIVAGGTIPYGGRDVTVEWREGAPRQVFLVTPPPVCAEPVEAPSQRRIGPSTGSGQTEGGEARLIVGGPLETLAPRVLRWLRAQALARLEAETRAFATRAGVAVGRVGVGDPRSRWGSCTGAGDIRYSWRLILAPPGVLEATVAHEVAHRLHMHHGPAFHAAVATLLGRDPAPERRWLRTHGPSLYWFGRDS